MVSILFVCYGNICRSPMAEYIFKYLGKNKYKVESRATSNEEIGNDMYYKSKEELIKHNIPFNRHYAQQITIEDYNNYDVIICFDDNNYHTLCNKFGSNKVRKLLKKEIDDPWYTRDFEKAYKDIYNGCINLLREIENE